MANKFTVKRSAVVGKIPTTNDLALGELALNTSDGKLFLKKSVNSLPFSLVKSNLQGKDVDNVSGFPPD